MEEIIDRLNKVELKCQYLDACICELKQIKQDQDNAKKLRKDYYKQRYRNDESYRNKLKATARQYYQKLKGQVKQSELIEKAKADEPVISDNDLNKEA